MSLYTPQLVEKETTDTRDDVKFLVVGCIGAALAGFVFPVCVIVFAIIMDLLFKNVDRCENSADTTDFEYDSCGSYYYDLSSHCIFVDGSLLH